MSSSQGKKGEAQKWVVGRGTFIGVTAMAVVMAVILVILGWVSSHGETISPPPPTTTSTPSPTVIVSGTSMGSPKAPVTIVMYSDFQCSHCQRFALTIEKQLEGNYVETGKVRIIYRHIVAYGPESLLAAEAAECAAEQNRFWPYHDLLMQLRASSTADDLPVEKLQSLAQQIGLDMATFNASLESGKYKAKVMQSDAEGRALGLTNIPAFFINGVKADDSVAGSFEAFQKILDDILTRSGK